MAQQFRTRKRLKVLQAFLTIRRQCRKRVRYCIKNFIAICLKKQERRHFIQRCLNLVLTLCRGVSRPKRTKCKDVMENIIDNKIEGISETTDVAYVS